MYQITGALFLLVLLSTRMAFVGESHVEVISKDFVVAVTYRTVYFWSFRQIEQELRMTITVYNCMILRISSLFIVIIPASQIMVGHRCITQHIHMRRLLIMRTR
jgi:hypothetical protein